jgi:hypothetical protein
MARLGSGGPPIGSRHFRPPTAVVFFRRFSEPYVVMRLRLVPAFCFSYRLLAASCLPLSGYSGASKRGAAFQLFCLLPSRYCAFLANSKPLIGSDCSSQNPHLVLSTCRSTYFLIFPLPAVSLLCRPIHLPTSLVTRSLKWYHSTTVWQTQPRFPL